MVQKKRPSAKKATAKKSVSHPEGSYLSLDEETLAALKAALKAGEGLNIIFDDLKVLGPSGRATPIENVQIRSTPPVIVSNIPTRQKRVKKVSQKKVGRKK